MKHDDAVLLESLLTDIVCGLKPALRSAELALEILAARRRRSEFGRRPDLVLAALIDDSSLAVRWNGEECHLGATVLFRLVRRLATSANQYISVERLLEDVWGGPRSEAAVRSAVRSLRRKLEAAGMEDIASAIQTQPGHYRLFFDGIARQD